MVPYPGSKSPFLSLSTDIVIEVLEHTDGRTIAICKRVCRVFRRFIEESPCLDYKIELAAASLVDHPPPGGHTIPVSERVERVRRYREAWTYLYPSDPITLLQGVKTTRWHFHPSGLFVFVTLSGDLSFVRLPSPLDPFTESRWTVPLQGRLPYRLSEFAVDPAQDLLVVLSCVSDLEFDMEWFEWKSHFRISLLRLDGSRHPLGSPAPVELGCITMGLEVSVHHDIILVHETRKPSRIWLWNWKIGTWLCKTSFCPGHVSFLGDSHLLAVTSQHVSVYGFGGDYTLTDMNGEPDICCILRADILNKFIKSVLSVNQPLRGPQSSFCRFDPQQAVYVIHLDVLSAQNESPEVSRLCVARTTILKWVRLVETGEHDWKFSWEEWKEQTTRISSLSPLDKFQQLRSDCGARLAIARKVNYSACLELHVLEYAVSEPDVATTSGGYSTPGGTYVRPSLRLRDLSTRCLWGLSDPCPRSVCLWQNGFVIAGDNLSIVCLQPRIRRE
ncbi:hypothetical protein C8Q79DRAFT_989317 [Trametes meyenii]|nr:hypothetical protein C8Q79DRAFT_989317 [Trametes meyenii]